MVSDVESGAIVDQVDTLVRRSGEAWWNSSIAVQLTWARPKSKLAWILGKQIRIWPVLTETHQSGGEVGRGISPTSADPRNILGDCPRLRWQDDGGEEGDTEDKGDRRHVGENSPRLISASVDVVFFEILRGSESSEKVSDTGLPAGGGASYINSTQLVAIVKSDNSQTYFPFVQKY